MNNLPAGWKLSRLEELATVERGKFSARPRNDPKFFGGDIPFVQTGEVSAAGTYLVNHKQTLNELGKTVSKVFPKDSILITIAANIGETAITTYEVACPDSVVAIIPKPAKAHVFWLKKVLETLKDDLDSKATQNAQKNINLEVLRPLEIATPPIEEQTKIAQILSAWDKAITTTERLLANSQQQKQALMQQLLTGQKRFAGFTDSWSHESFESLVEINYGKSPKDIPKEGEFPIIGTGGVVGNTSIPLHSKPAVVIGRKGTIDKPVFVTTPFWAIDTAFYCCPKPKCDIQWFYYICSNINLKTYNEASGVPSLSRETLYGISVKTPPLPEQQKIAQVLSTADAEITNLQAQLAKLKLEKKALMQQLLTGQRRVRLDDELEEEPQIRRVG